MGKYALEGRTLLAPWVDGLGWVRTYGLFARGRLGGGLIGWLGGICCVPVAGI